MKETTYILQQVELVTVTSYYRLHVYCSKLDYSDCTSYYRLHILQQVGLVTVPATIDYIYCSKLD